MVVMFVFLVTGLLIGSPGADQNQPASIAPPGAPPGVVVPPGAPPPGPPPDQRTLPVPSILNLGNGTYKLANIIIDKRKGEIRVPGKVNMQEGLVELLACGKWGKLHESVLVIDVQPYYLQLALLLLGLEPGNKPLAYQGDPHTPVGDHVDIFVEWKNNGKIVKKRGEELVFNRVTGKPMKKTYWVFTGSLIQNGIFLAQVEQSLVTTFHDPATIIDNPLPAGGDDTLYYANKKVVPPVGTPVTMVIKKLNTRKER